MTDSLPSEGPPTLEEEKFTDYLLFCIAEYIKHECSLKRGVLLAAVSRLSQIAFCEFDSEYRFDLKSTIKEIDEFCNHLKKHALRNARIE